MVNLFSEAINFHESSSSESKREKKGFVMVHLIDYAFLDASKLTHIQNGK